MISLKTKETTPLSKVDLVLEFVKRIGLVKIEVSQLIDKLTIYRTSL